jgi:F-type H+-transporting ATPase subunit c
MKKTVSILIVALAALMMMAPFALAAEEEAAGGGDSGLAAMAVIGAGIGIGVAALGTGIGQGIGLSKACEGVARNPGASGKITTTLIIGLAMIESLCIYALLVSLGILINQGIFF